MKERLLHVRHAKAFSFYKPRAFNKAEVSGDFNPVKWVKVCIKSSVLPLLSTCWRNACPTSRFKAPRLAKQSAMLSAKTSVQR